MFDYGIIIHMSTGVIVSVSLSRCIALKTVQNYGYSRTER